MSHIYYDVIYLVSVSGQFIRSLKQIHLCIIHWVLHYPKGVRVMKTSCFNDEKILKVN